MLTEKTWQKVATMALLVFSVGVIIWSGVTLWQLPCPEGGRLSWATTTPCRFSLQSIVTLLVAFGFWLSGLVIWLAGRKKTSITFLLLVAGILSSGELSNMSSRLGWHLFVILMAWSSPALFHFHLRFLQQQPQPQKRAVLLVLSGFALFLTIPPLFWSPSFIEQQTWFSPWHLGLRLAPLSTFVLTTILLWREYQHAASFVNRQRIRLISFGTLFAFTPTALLSLLPHTLGAPVYVPYTLTFPWLLIAPLTHVYTFFPERLARYRDLLNQAVANYILVVLLTAVYLAAMIISLRLEIATLSQWLLISTLLSIGLLFIFARLQAGLGQFTDWIWYGQEKDYTEGVASLSEALALTLDRQTLQRLLLHELTGLMDSPWGALYLKENPDSLVIVGASRPEIEKWPHLSLRGAVATRLEKIGQPVTGAQLAYYNAGALLQEADQQLLSWAAATMWIPLISGKKLQGLLLLGANPSRVTFTSKEKQVLAVLGYQAGSAAHNIHLVAEVKARQEELAQAHQALLLVREEEQKKLAWTLHDGPIQDLLAISQHLALLAQQSPQAVEIMKLRQGIIDEVTVLREIYRHLRPGVLDELGLTQALRVLAREYEYNHGVRVVFFSPNNIELLSDTAATALFRTAQEGLNNVVRHSQAAQAQLRLSGAEQRVTLTLTDNGCGFVLPQRLTMFARSGHFGLVSLAEQLAQLGGQLTVQTAPGEGTRLQAWLPVPGEFNMGTAHPKE
jgi:signal transduction histidine kinase